MLKIRLDRSGRENNLFYRIIVTDSRNKMGGQPKEKIGFWHPSKNNLKIDKDKLKFWVEKGAQVTTAVEKLLSKKNA